jgi:hypothetical protein
MLLGKVPDFVKRFAGVWDSITHLSDLCMLKKHLETSQLVAIDLEGQSSKIYEVGLATLCTSAVKSLRVPDDGSLQKFYLQNEIRATSIIVEEDRLKGTESLKYGQQFTVPEDDVCDKLHEILSNLSHHPGPLILVGYAMYSEFAWISRACPSFLSRFEYWVDVQELVEESCGSHPRAWLIERQRSPSSQLTEHPTTPSEHLLCYLNSCLLITLTIKKRRNPNCVLLILGSGKISRSGPASQLWTMTPYRLALDHHECWLSFLRHTSHQLCL